MHHHTMMSEVFVHVTVETAENVSSLVTTHERHHIVTSQQDVQGTALSMMYYMVSDLMAPMLCREQ